MTKDGSMAESITKDKVDQALETFLHLMHEAHCSYENAMETGIDEDKNFLSLLIRTLRGVFALSIPPTVIGNPRYNPLWCDLEPAAADAIPSGSSSAHPVSHESNSGKIILEWINNILQQGANTMNDTMYSTAVIWEAVLELSKEEVESVLSSLLEKHSDLYRRQSRCSNQSTFVTPNPNTKFYEGRAQRDTSPDENLIAQLQSKGYSRNGAKRSVIATDSASFEAAFRWAIENSDHPEFEMPIAHKVDGALSDMKQENRSMPHNLSTDANPNQNIASGQDLQNEERSPSAGEVTKYMSILHKFIESFCTSRLFLQRQVASTFRESR